MKGKNTLNFDEFFQFSKQLIEEQIKKNPALIIDASEVQASCLFCPYTSDIPKSTAWYWIELFDKTTILTVNIIVFGNTWLLVLLNETKRIVKMSMNRELMMMSLTWT